MVPDQLELEQMVIQAVQKTMVAAVAVTKEEEDGEEEEEEEQERKKKGFGRKFFKKWARKKK